MRVLGTVFLVSLLRVSRGQRAFQGPAQREADRHDSADAGTDASDAGAIMLVGQSLATYKAQRLKLRWDDQDPCGSPSCNQTCSWRGLICRCATMRSSLGLAVISMRLGDGFPSLWGGVKIKAQKGKNQSAED